jgi:hypothetical protein
LHFFDTLLNCSVLCNETKNFRGRTWMELLDYVGLLACDGRNTRVRFLRNQRVLPLLLQSWCILRNDFWRQVFQRNFKKHSWYKSAQVNCQILCFSYLL